MKNKRINKQIPFFDHCFDKSRLKKWISQLYYETINTEDLTILNFVETLKTIGFQEATRAGVSIGIDDLRIPPKKALLLKEIEYEVEKTTQSFSLNRLTALENFQTFIDTWHKTSELIKMEVVANFEQTDTLNPVYMMAFSGARGNLSQVSQLVGMRGFMSDPEGQIIDYPIRSNFREGLTLTEYVISCYGARKGLVDTALRTADAGYLTRRLVDVAHSIVITCFDCKTTQGIWLSAIKENNQVMYPLEKRLMGRVLAENIYFPYNEPETNDNQIVQWSYFQKNQQIDAVNAKLLAKCFTRVLVRSPLRCLKKKRLCQLCYGWTLPHAYLAPIGEAVGILAAQSIGEPGTQLTMRTFHTGGVFSGALSEELKAPYSGRIKYKSSIQGALFRSANGQVAYRTIEPGYLVLEPLTKDVQDKVFELNFPATSILFRKNNEKINQGDVLIELPKDQDVGKETVLNTYTYYSKRSGIINVYKTNLYPFENYDLVSHPKLPKIEPFYQKAQSINRTFHSFKIYSGQILKTYQTQQLLAQPGDLVNNQSILNYKQLQFSPKTSLTCSKWEKNTSQQKLLNNIFTKTSVFSLSISNLTYQKYLGYTSTLKHQNFQKPIQFIFPSLESNLMFSQFNRGIEIYNPQFKIKGKWLYPIIFSQLQNIQITGSWEKYLYFNQLQKPIPLRIGFKKLTQLVILNNKYRSLNQLSFCIPQSQYKSFKTIFGQTKLLKNKIFQNRQQYGYLLSNYKMSQNQPITKNLNKLSWKNRGTILITKPNLQQNDLQARANEDGFLIKQSAKKFNDFNITKKKTSYWHANTKYVFKAGWPIYSFSKQKIYKLQNKLHLIGQMILKDINFLTKSKLTEYLPYSSPLSLMGQKLANKAIQLRKTKLSFNQIKNQNRILLIRSAVEVSFVGLNTDRKIFQKALYQDDTFNNFKQIQFFEKTNYKKSQLKTIFNEINKLEPTTNKIASLNSHRLSLNIKTFSQDVINMRNMGSTLTNSYSVFEDSHSQNFTLIHLNLTLNENTSLKSQVQSFTSNNIFNRRYSYGFSSKLSQQNFLRNTPNSFFVLNGSSQTKGTSLRSRFFCPHTGELVLNIKNKGEEISSLILTTNDTYTIPINGLARKVEIGDFIYAGFPITTTETVQATGQVIQINKNYIKVQFIENSLVASNSRFFCKNNQFIEKTNQIFTQSYPRLQMGDIVQGIPKIEEFFEARQTKDGNPFDNNLHNRLKRRFVFYRKNCGYPLFIATRKSIYDIQNLIIDSIFKLYSSQGIDISDKHLEIIVRQMTSKVKVTQFWKYGTPFVPFKHPLPTELYSCQYIERYQYRKKNTRIYNVRYEPAILGITRAALENDGFISAASFQETTRILSRGAIFQKKDYLKGLKENVILGHIIPAGTAVRTYSRRFQPSLMQQILAKQTLQILTINHEWKLGMVDSTAVSSQYFNPIRHTILQCICLEYLKLI